MLVTNGKGHKALLSDRIEAASDSVYEMLRSRDPKDFGISDYSARYLRESLQQGTIVPRIFSRILSVGLRDVVADPSDVTVVDFGGGNGLLSLIAREAGVGTVIFNDIYDTSCVDAARIGAALGLEADHYVHGDIEALAPEVRRWSAGPTVVCSYDVIEHVYDVDQMVTELTRFSDESLTVVMASSANGLNPRRRAQLMGFQRQVENVDRPDVKGHNQRDSLRAYRTIRTEMIRARAPALGPHQVAALARVTRGRAGTDIDDVVDAYLATGILPSELAHPTNTCDPSTGNWAEHLMDPRALQQALADRGFKARVESGYYGRYPGLKGGLARILNVAMRVIGGRHALRIAPYYILVGVRP